MVARYGQSKLGYNKEARDASRVLRLYAAKKHERTLREPITGNMMGMTWLNCSCSWGSSAGDNIYLDDAWKAHLEDIERAHRVAPKILEALKEG